MDFLPRQRSENLIHFDKKYTEDDLKQIIRSLNLKITDQRMIILKSILDGRRHVSAQELFEKINPKFPDIGFATVYRFLKSMTEGGLMTEMRMGGMPARYELTSKNHHDHLTCVECGQIVEFENKDIEALQESVAKQFGFILKHHILELYGVCSKCQSKKKG